MAEPTPPDAASGECPTLDVLERLAAASDRMTFDALLRQLGLPASVLRGRLRRLVERGWVETDERDHTYSIGVGALRPGSAFLFTDRTVRLAGPLLSRLRAQLDESVRLVRLDGAAVVGVASREASHDLAGPAVGRRVPAYAAASGQAILAHRSRAEVEAVLDLGHQPHTCDTPADREAFFALLAECRQRGWAYERGQFVAGIGCVAAAVVGDGPVTDAISVLVPLARLTDDHATEIAAYLLRTTRDLSDALRR